MLLRRKGTLFVGEEYEVRKEENKRYAAQLGIPFVDVDGDVDEWYRRAKGMEFCPERGARCTMCFDMRLERTALYAHEHGLALDDAKLEVLPEENKSSRHEGVMSEVGLEDSCKA